MYAILFFTVKKPHAHGFTLIELMIVVAIVGILMAIAIPSFNRFRSKSKQAEPKTHLAAIAKLAKDSYVDNESYVTQAATMWGWTMATAATTSVNTSLFYSYSNNSNTVQGIYESTGGVCGVNFGSNTATTFTVGSVANIDDDERCDAWTITESGSPTILGQYDDVLYSGPN